MADTGWHNPGTVISDSASGGTKAWGNPANAKTSNNVYAIAAGASGGGNSYYLKCTNFSMGVPAGATIDGILVQIERKRGTNCCVHEWKIYIVRETGAYGTTNKAAHEWTTSDVYCSHGGTTDKWGLSWTPAKINDADFGVGIAISLDEGFTAGSVDHVRIKVYYTEPVGTNIKINIGDSFRDVAEIKINIGDSWRAVAGIWINIGDVWRKVF